MENKAQVCHEKHAKDVDWSCAQEITTLLLSSAKADKARFFLLLTVYGLTL